MKRVVYARKKIIFICLLCLLISKTIFSQDVKDELAEALCGPYALMVVAKTFGVEADLSSIADLAGTTRQGTTMKGLVDAAHELGLRARGLKIARHQLMDLKLPTIAYVNDNHFFVIDQILKDKLSITDINMEFNFMSLEEFDQIWDGHVLTILPRRLEKSENQPNIWVDRFVHDFGVAASDLIETDFTIENTGNADLIIRDLIPGCNCAKFEISRKIIPPGEQAQLTMVFSLTGQWGETSTTAKLLSNDSNQPILTFVIKGIAKTTLAISPRSIELGRIIETDKEKSISQKIKIRDPGTGNLKIKKVKTSSDAVSAQLFQEKTGVDAVIGISVIPDRCARISPDGKFAEHVTIYTNHTESSELVVPIQGEIGPVIQIFPDRLFFGLVKKGESPSKSVVVKGDEKTIWEIAKVETDSQAISINIIPVTPRQEYRIQAHLLSDQVNSDMIKGTVTLHTDHPKQPYVEIPIYAIIQ